MHLIPEFDGHSVEVFIDRIRAAVKRLATEATNTNHFSAVSPHRNSGRAKGTIRLDTTPNFPQLYEKLRTLFGKYLLELQRDTCIQRHNETVDFINCFLRIHDEIIAAVNLQNKGTATICIQEALSTESNRCFSPQREIKNRQSPLFLRIGHVSSIVICIKHFPKQEHSKKN